MRDLMRELGSEAKAAAGRLAMADSGVKNEALLAAARIMQEREKEILSANVCDVEAAKDKGLEASLIDRLVLNEGRVAAMVQGLIDIVELDDPVGRKLFSCVRPNGLEISRVSVPLGVVGIIYESRPNVTSDAGALCLKSGNATILRCGSESINSSSEILLCLQGGLKEVGLPVNAVQIVPTVDREAVGEMLRLSEYIDVIVPRGGKSLCKRVQDESVIPTLQHLDGNCHTYVHESASVEMAVAVVENAKLRRTGICGATESLVVDRKISEVVLPKIIAVLVEGGCQVRGDEEVQKIDKCVVSASEEDWDQEYLAPIISVKIVDDFDMAVDFVNRHSSHHTDAIIAEDKEVAAEFLGRVDSAIVMHNTSTQFADGGEFGMGAEIGISTGKLHARGPVGLEGLTTYKYLVFGDGQVRAK